MSTHETEEQPVTRHPAFYPWAGEIWPKIPQQVDLDEE